MVEPDAEPGNEPEGGDSSSNGPTLAAAAEQTPAEEEEECRVCRGPAEEG